MQRSRLRSRSRSRSLQQDPSDLARVLVAPSAIDVVSTLEETANTPSDIARLIASYNTITGYERFFTLPDHPSQVPRLIEQVLKGIDTDVERTVLPRPLRRDRGSRQLHTIRLRFYSVPILNDILNSASFRRQYPSIMNLANIEDRIQRVVDQHYRIQYR